MDEMYDELEKMLDQCPEVHNLTAITFLQVAKHAAAEPYLPNHTFYST